MKTEEMFGGKGTEMWIMNGCVCAGGAVGGGMFCPVCPRTNPGTPSWPLGPAVG